MKAFLAVLALLMFTGVMVSSDPLPPGSVKVKWTAVGDDGPNGRAAAYVLQFKRLVQPTFVSLTAMPAPGASGTLDSCIVTSLTPDSTYQFRLQVFDEVGNASGFSNTATITIPSAAPRDTVPPGTPTIGVTTGDNLIAPGGVTAPLVIPPGADVSGALIDRRRGR